MRRVMGYNIVAHHQELLTGNLAQKVPKYTGVRYCISCIFLKGIWLAQKLHKYAVSILIVGA